MLAVMAGPDIRDWYAGPELSIDYRNGLRDGVQELRIAYSRTLGYAKATRDVVSLVDKAVEDLVCLGAHVEEIDPGLDDPIEIMQPLWSVGIALSVSPMTSDHRALIDRPLLDLAEPGFRLTALDYRRLEQARENFGRRMALLHAKYDLLITPQLAITAFTAGHEVPPES